MQLNTTTNGTVTPLATIRAIRAVTPETLGRRVGVEPEQVFRWETDQEPIPSDAMCKRLGLALMWPWRDLAAPAVPYSDAWRALVDARQRSAASR
jgi:hypothetical protein